MQLSYAVLSDDALALPPELRAPAPQPKLPRELPGRRIPEVVPFSELASGALANRLVPLPEANTLAHLNYQDRRFGRLQTKPSETMLFNPETILVKLRSRLQVDAIRVEPMREWEAVQTLKRRPDVQFAELDTFEQRQLTPNDPSSRINGITRSSAASRLGA